LQAQNNAYDANRLNNYKYVVIPMQFSFQNKPNEYLINSRVMHLLDQNGFTTIMSTEKYTDDLAFKPCLALYAHFKSIFECFFSFNTFLQLFLENCHNEDVYKTRVGKSSTKDLAQAYKEALHEAFQSFVTVDYKYNGNKGIEKRKPVAEGTAKMQPIEP